jgi:hypothetical protein
MYLDTTTGKRMAAVPEKWRKEATLAAAIRGEAQINVEYF